MQSIRKRLSILFAVCSIGAIFLIILFVNITINKKFNQYMLDIQNKRYERIVGFFKETYKKEGKWTENSGALLMHEAYMSNYCLTLYDKDRNVVWGMDPNDVRSRLHLNTMLVKEKGVYNTKAFDIKLEDGIVGYVEIGQYSSVLLTEEDVNFKIAVNRSIIASGILTLIIIVGLSLYISKEFSMPIKEVSYMSASLSRGKFDVYIKEKSDIEELESLRYSINILAEKLKQQDMLRKRLVSDISHEIRTPLNVLQNNLEAMIDGILPVDINRLNSLNEEVIRFGELLDNLNILKGFETESISLDLEQVSLINLLEDVCKDFSVAVENRNLSFYCNIDSEECKIVGDKNKLKQVFINLLSNAVKFTKEDDEISVSIEKYKNLIKIEIRDTGIGIDKEDLPFIFERLYRGDKSRNQIEGAGIGLTIVKNILNLHSAAIEVDSEKNKGTLFKIFFKPLIK